MLNLGREKPSEVLALAKKWDKLGLLYLKESYDDQVDPDDAVRVFNAYKNESCDRQIGDRRSRNYRERRLQGPSSLLPCGPALLGIRVDPLRESLSISITDRKDFYHQLFSAPRKAVHNSLYPPLREVDLRGTQALAKMHSRLAGVSRPLGAPSGQESGSLFPGCVPRRPPRCRAGYQRPPQPLETSWLASAGL